MTSLTFLHEPGVLWNLQQRYSRSVVYTRTGGILIAINPFAPLPHLYGPAVMQRYAGLEPQETAPHPYAIANAAYTKMRREGKGQAILVSSCSSNSRTSAAAEAASG
jgi:myosin-5